MMFDLNLFTPSMLFYWTSRDVYSEHAVLLGRVGMFTPGMLFYWKSRDVYSEHAVLLEE